MPAPPPARSPSCPLPQVDQDIIRGRLGRGHRRDSSAQITTIDADGCGNMGYGDLGTPPHSDKRRRSSLAQLGELLQSWGSRCSNLPLLLTPSYRLLLLS